MVGVPSPPLPVDLLACKSIQAEQVYSKWNVYVWLQIIIIKNNYNLTNYWLGSHYLRY